MTPPVGSGVREVAAARGAEAAPAGLREGQGEQCPVLPEHPGAADPLHRQGDAGEAHRVL